MKGSLRWVYSRADPWVTSHGTSGEARGADLDGIGGIRNHKERKSGCLEGSD